MYVLIKDIEVKNYLKKWQLDLRIMPKLKIIH